MNNAREQHEYYTGINQVRLTHHKSSMVTYHHYCFSGNSVWQRKFRETLKKNIGNFYFLTPWQTRTHCCRHIVDDTNVSPFARARNICCGHKFFVRDTKNVSDFVQKHFVSGTNVSHFAQPKKHHGQQCVLVYQGLNAHTLSSLNCFG